MEKWLRCVPRARDPHDPAAALAALGASDAQQRVIDVVGADQELLALHGMPPQDPVRYELLLWEWREKRPSLGPDEPAYRVSERPVFDELPPRDSAGWRPGVKQISFLVRPEGLSRDGFRELYHHHTEKLRDDQPGIAKYVQNVVEECAPGARALDGFSELWFASLEDFRLRYWSSPDVPAREHEETSRFLDFRRSGSILVRERVLDPD